VVGKEALFEAVWPGVAVVEDSLVQCVGEIRAALGEADRGALRTLPKRGYALEAAAVEAAAGAPEAPAGAAASNAAAAGAAAGGSAAVGGAAVGGATAVEAAAGAGGAAARDAWPAGRARRLWPAVALGAAALVAAGLALRPEARAPAPASIEAAVAAERAAVDALHASVLVLPFEDLSEAGDLGHFADGMTEDLIAELSRWREVRVIARTSANTFKGRAVDARQAAAEMRVRYVLEGSLRRIGEKLRVTAQLVDGASGDALWAERFDETGADVLALQDGVIARVLATLSGNHGVIKQTDARTAWRKADVDLDEYDYFLRGHDHHYRFTPADNERALAIYREGLARFPDSGLLEIKIGWSLNTAGRLGWVEDGAAAIAEAARLAEKGLRDPDLPAAGYRFGLWLQVYSDVFHRRDYAAAVRHARQVVAAFPYDTEGLTTMAYQVTLAGELDLARGWIATALARDRDPPALALAFSTEHAYVDGRFDDALALGARMADPGYRATPPLAASLVALGRTEEARALLAGLSRDHPWLTPETLAASRPYRDPAVMATLLARLAAAGWPPAGP
jgi:TolB-like protein